MKEVLTKAERAEIYETAWRVYCSTQSTYYAHSRAASVGDRLHVMPIRTDEIARAAIEKISELQRIYADGLINDVKYYCDAYCAKYPSTSNVYKESGDVAADGSR